MQEYVQMGQAAAAPEGNHGVKASGQCVKASGRQQSHVQGRIKGSSRDGCQGGWAEGSGTMG